MSDELDPVLKRLFAETAEHPADEAFVAVVTARTARAGRLGLARPVGAALVGAVGVAALALGLGLAVSQIAPVLNASPMGTAAALALVLAGLVYGRLLTPLLWRRLL